MKSAGTVMMTMLASRGTSPRLCSCSRFSILCFSHSSFYYHHYYRFNRHSQRQSSVVATRCTPLLTNLTLYICKLFGGFQWSRNSSPFFSLSSSSSSFFSFSSFPLPYFPSLLFPFSLPSFPSFLPLPSPPPPLPSLHRQVHEHDDVT